MTKGLTHSLPRVGVRLLLATLVVPMFPACGGDGDMTPMWPKGNVVFMDTNNYTSTTSLDIPVVHDHVRRRPEHLLGRADERPALPRHRRRWRRQRHRQRLLLEDPEHEAGGGFECARGRPARREPGVQVRRLQHGADRPSVEVRDAVAVQARRFDRTRHRLRRAERHGHHLHAAVHERHHPRRRFEVDAVPRSDGVRLRPSRPSTPARTTCCTSRRRSARR